MLQERGRGFDGEDFTVFRALPHRNILHGEHNPSKPTNHPPNKPTNNEANIMLKVGEQPFRAVMVKERKGSHSGQDSAERTEVFRQQNEQHHGTDQMN